MILESRTKSYGVNRAVEIMEWSVVREADAIVVAQNNVLGAYAAKRFIEGSVPFSVNCLT